MNAEEPFPPALPTVVPSPIGPAISYSNIRAVTSRAESLLNQLDKKIRKPVVAGLDAAGSQGARLEGKVLSRLADQLTIPETVHNDTVQSIQHQLAANMVPAVIAAEDFGGAPYQETSSANTAAGGQQRAVVSTGAVLSSPVVGGRGAIIQNRMLGGPRVGPAFFTPLLGEMNPGLTPPGPCPMIDQPTWEQWQTMAQAIADECNKKGGLAGEEFTGNWWRCSEDCCVIGPVRAPNDNPAPPIAKFFDFGIDGYASCVKPAFAWFLKQWNPKGFVCGGPPPVDCVTHPLDPSCPPDCVKHPEDPRCPPPPPPTDHCPPPCAPPCIEVKVPPCPTLQLPTCVQIDLCDWDKFCQALKDCLVKSKQDCALDNEESWVLDDCEGLLGDAQKKFFATSGDALTNASTVQQAVQPSTLQQNQLVQVFRVGRNLFDDLMPA